MKIQRQVWVIMDKGHKAIACGTARNRHIQMIDGNWSMRLITYVSKGKAEAGFKVSQFYLGNARDYMTETYGEDWERVERDGSITKGRTVNQYEKYNEIYEAVPATITLEI